MRVLLAIITVISLASCDTPRYAYSPTAHNVPVLVKQGDAVKVKQLRCKIAYYS